MYKNVISMEYAVSASTLFLSCLNEMLCTFALIAQIKDKNRYHLNFLAFKSSYLLACYLISTGRFIYSIRALGLFLEYSMWSDDLQQTLSLIESTGSIGLRTTFLSLAIERFFATAYSATYETDRRFFLLPALLIPLSYAFALIWSMSFLKWSLPYIIFVTCTTLIDIAGTISCLMLAYYNKRLRKQNLRTDIQLSQRYQINENLRVLGIIRPIMMAGVTFLTVAVWIRFLLKQIIGGYIGEKSRDIFYLLVQVYVTLACFILLSRGQFNFCCIFPTSFKLRKPKPHIISHSAKAADSPLSYMNFNGNVVCPLKTHREITNSLGEKINIEPSITDHFKKYMGHLKSPSVRSFVLGDTHITPDIRADITYGHNWRRASLASGLVQQFDCSNMPQAKKISRLAYDCKLEHSAKKWSQNCVWEHSKSHVGENLYAVSPPFPIREGMKMAMKAWWDEELKNLTESLPKELTSNFMNRTKAGHFTQMSTDLITTVGCAATVCPNLGLFVVCHYDKRQFDRRPIYTAGRKCSECHHCEAKTGLCEISKSLKRHMDHDKQCNVAPEKSINLDATITHPVCNGGSRSKNKGTDNVKKHKHSGKKRNKKHGADKKKNKNRTRHMQKLEDKFKNVFDNGKTETETYNFHMTDINGKIKEETVITKNGKVKKYERKVGKDKNWEGFFDREFDDFFNHF
ncbi:cysteine-rich secretory protein family domain-containing protein [Ditylenchus destructor]|nr:cysteine-rich secretory protein family domain-containing protein [Ditylenchus destructor]